jgi:hypothetical protein
MGIVGNFNIISLYQIGRKESIFPFQKEMPLIIEGMEGVITGDQYS